MRPGVVTRLSRSALCGLTVSLVICSAAAAEIALSRSIDGAALGMTHSQVAKILGKGKRESGGSLQYDYEHDGYQVGFTSSGHASSIETFKRGQRTANGLGVGTSLSALKAHQPGLHCQLDQMDGTRDCYVGSIKRGHRYTDFFFDGSGANKKVSAVIVGDGYR